MTHILHGNDTRGRHQRVREGGFACPRDTLPPREYDWTAHARANAVHKQRSVQRTIATTMLAHRHHCSPWSTWAMTDIFLMLGCKEALKTCKT